MSKVAWVIFYILLRRREGAKFFFELPNNWTNTLRLEKALAKLLVIWLKPLMLNFLRHPAKAGRNSTLLLKLNLCL